MRYVEDCAGMQTVSYTRKQVNVLYGAWKRGEIEMTKEMFSFLYDEVEFKSYDSNGSREWLERPVLTMIDAFFEKDYEKFNEKRDFLARQIEIAFSGKNSTKKYIAKEA